MKRLWGGRFDKTEMDAKVLEFTSSLGIDSVLAGYDCLSSKVHAQALYRAGVLSSEERDDLINVLDKLAEHIADGRFRAEGHEDIHSAIHAFVRDKLPETGKKLHTARSRNEQIVNDVRLFLMDRLNCLCSKVGSLQRSITTAAERTPEAIIPGYTHMNRAQPVLWSHLLLSYVEMLERDRSRFLDARGRVDVCVMGSGALAGSSLDLDRRYIAKELGFSDVSANSMDAVSDRDFICETLFTATMTGIHLSRISEDLILYSSSEFGFLEIGPEYCTGSSLMPQKKNADVLELIRGRSAFLVSALNGMMVLLKGLPHCYNRDLQDDKRFLNDTVFLLSDMLDMMSLVVDSLVINEDVAHALLDDELIYATDIAEYLVRKGVDFETAHGVVGNLVKHCVREKIDISELALSELKKFSPLLEKDIVRLLDAASSVRGKRTAGSTNPDMVKERISFWKKTLGGRDA